MLKSQTGRVHPTNPGNYVYSVSVRINLVAADEERITESDPETGIIIQGTIRPFAGGEKTRVSAQDPSVGDLERHILIR